MTNDTRKPREFWIHVTADGTYMLFDEKQCEKDFKVIEFSSYKNLLKSHDDLAYKAIEKELAAANKYKADIFQVHRYEDFLEHVVDLEEQNEALRKERDELKFALEHFSDDANGRLVSLTQERDEYRAALEKLKAGDILPNFATNVLAKYPKKEGK